MNNKLVLVAFGGNALLCAGQQGTIQEQLVNVYDSCKSLLPFIKQGYNLVIAHGNGPQVGNAMLRNIAGNKLYGLPLMPLDICGSYTQGYIGYIIEQQFRNILIHEGIDKNIITLVTQVEVDAEDEAFQRPVKPVGPYFSAEEVRTLLAQNPEETYVQDPKRQAYRKVVASPTPVEIKNTDIVARLAREGTIVITVGGGGIPIIKHADNSYSGTEAVIDKDLASALMAAIIGADEFYILTDIPQVCLNFNTPNEKKLDRLTLEEARNYLSEGHFSEGSMAPKIRAAMHFIEKGGKECIITDAEHLHIPNAGTRIVS